MTPATVEPQQLFLAMTIIKYSDKKSNLLKHKQKQFITCTIKHKLCLKTLPHLKIYNSLC